MTRPRKIVGVPWFALDSYARCRFQMTDKSSLPLEFTDWLAAAEASVQAIEEEGQSAMKVAIDPARFPVWCRERGLQPDARARQRYANFHAFHAAIA